MILEKGLVYNPVGEHSDMRFPQILGWMAARLPVSAATALL